MNYIYLIIKIFGAYYYARRPEIFIGGTKKLKESCNFIRHCFILTFVPDNKLLLSDPACKAVKSKFFLYSA